MPTQGNTTKPIDDDAKKEPHGIIILAEVKGIIDACNGEFRLFTDSGVSTREYFFRSTSATGTHKNSGLARRDVDRWVQKLVKYIGLRPLRTIKTSLVKSKTGGKKVTQKFYCPSETIFGTCYDEAGKLTVARAGGVREQLKTGQSADAAIAQMSNSHRVAQAANSEH